MKDSTGALIVVAMLALVAAFYITPGLWSALRDSLLTVAGTLFIVVGVLLCVYAWWYHRT